MSEPLDDKDVFEHEITVEGVRANIDEWKAAKPSPYKSSVIAALQNLERLLIDRDVRVANRTTREGGRQ